MRRILAIGGCSNSGKSLLARELSKILPYHTTIVAQDDHIVSIDKIPRVRDRVDWERPESIDWQGLEYVVTHAQADLVIVEGFLVYYDLKLSQHFDLKLFLEIDFEIFIQRRSKETRWGAEPRWYLEHVWHSYLIHGVPPEPFDQYTFIEMNDQPDIEALAATIEAQLKMLK